MSQEEFTSLLLKKIDQVSIKEIKEDIARFIPDDKPLEIWSAAYFKERCQTHQVRLEASHHLPG